MESFYQQFRFFYSTLLEKIVNSQKKELIYLHESLLLFFLRILSFTVFYLDPANKRIIKDFNNQLKAFVLHNDGKTIYYPLILDIINKELSIRDLKELILSNIDDSTWEQMVKSLLSVRWQIKETFIDNTKENLITPEFLSFFYESILRDYEDLHSLSPLVSKRKKKGSFYTPWKIIKEISNEIMNKLAITDNDNGYQTITEASNLTVLDPSCGSGSFLLFFAELLFSNVKKDLVNVDDLKLKKQIINNIIYGVDVSEISVKITRIRLLFWLVQDYDSTIANNEVLKNIHLSNIKVGNALFGHLNEKLSKSLDYYHKLNQLKEMSTNDGKREFLKDQFTEMIDNMYRNYLLEKNKKYSDIPRIIVDDLNKLPLFHWSIEFPKIVDQGGFDIIIGNPPYGRSVLNFLEKTLAKLIYSSCYGQSKKYSLNAAAPFIERSIKLLKNNGLLGMIVPFSIVRVEEFEQLRLFILKNSRIFKIIDKADAFDQQKVTLEMMNLFLKKEKNPKDYMIEIIPRTSTKVNVVPVSIFNKYRRFMIYYDSIWEKISSNSRLNVVIGDYGIDHRVCDRDLKKRPANSYNIPFLHSGKSVNYYSLEQSYFLWSKKLSYSKRFVHYYNHEKLVCTAIGNYLRVAYKPKKIIPGTNVAVLEVPPDYDLFGMLVILNSRLMTYVLNKYLLSHSNLTVYIHKAYTSLLPIKKPTTVFTILGKYLTLLSYLDSEASSQLFNFFGNIANCLVYEYYFPEELKNTIGSVLEKELQPISLNDDDIYHLVSKRSITDINRGLSLQEKLDKIITTYKTLKKNQLFMGMLKQVNKFDLIEDVSLTKNNRPPTCD